MKGLIAIVFTFLALSTQASVGIKAQDLKALKLSSGEIISKLSLQESTKVLESLDQDKNIEIRSRIIYPEEVSQLIVARLTKARFTEKRPNPQDYN
ncbi:MAG: hypothetical protein KBD76_10130 [Bacteriovorax sp.]|nr:hypothetical protein [Bacteriovorax sp.]